MKYSLKCLIIITLLLSNLITNGQTEEVQTNDEETESLKKHSLAFFMSHSFISQGKIDGDREWLAVPSLALNYNYKISEKWSIGLHNDIIIESFVVEHEEPDEDILEREHPISNLIVGSYKLSEPWSLAFGAGAEWEKNETFALLRFGTEYGLELKNESLELLFAFNYDLLIDAYDSFNLGIGIAKRF